MSSYTLALTGGGAIGLAGALLYLGNGRILGASGIAGRVWSAQAGWRWALLAGLLSGGAAFARWRPQSFGAAHWAGSGTLVVAGLLVGVGTQLANGCTSGHG